MRYERIRRIALLVMGIAAGAVAVQLMWVAGIAQTGGRGTPPNFEVTAQVPNHEPKEFVFRPVKPDLTPEKLQGYAKAFGMTGQPAAKGEAFALDQGERTLRVLAESGSIMFYDNSKMGTNARKSLPDAKQAELKADQFIKQNSLLGSEAHKRNVDIVTLQKQLKAGGQTESLPIEARVNYEFKLRGKTVEGPGAKATVFLGNAGEVIGFAKAWREVTQDKEVGTRSGQAALAEVKKKGLWNLHKQGGGGVRTVKIKKVRAAFWAEDIGKGMVAVEPAYVFEGTFVRSDGVEVPFLQKISAVATTEESAEPPAPLPSDPRP